MCAGKELEQPDWQLELPLGNQHLSLRFGYLADSHVRCKSTLAADVWADTGCMQSPPFPLSIPSPSSQFLLAAMCQFRPDCIQLMNHFTAPPENCVWQLTQINYAHLWGFAGFLGVGAAACWGLDLWTTVLIVARLSSVRLGLALPTNRFELLMALLFWQDASLLLAGLAPFGFCFRFC